MKLIFNKDDSAHSEIREVTGFTDADLDFEVLKPSIEIATDELIKVIGADTYKAIYDAYKDGGAVISKEIVRKAQRAVAFRAIMLLAPLKDLAFTNQGRAMRSDTHLKSPFEWQIVKHDESLEAIYYRSLDALIEALDLSNPVVSGTVKWKDTEVYKNSFNILFRTTDEFNEYFAIESRYLLMKLSPGLKKVQKEEIIPRMTAELYEDYVEKLKASEDVPNPKILSLMKEASAYLALAWAVPRMSAVLFPSGVFQNYAASKDSFRGKQVPQKSEVGVITLLFQEDGKKALHQLEELLKPIQPKDESPLYEMKINPRDKYVSI